MTATSTLWFTSLLLLAACWSQPAGQAEASGEDVRPATSDVVQALVGAYPDWVRETADGGLELVDGTPLVISDGRDKSPEERLESPDLDDMFADPYPWGAAIAAPRGDPGRVRYAPLFDAMYGDCRRNEVAENLRAVRWIEGSGETVMFTEVNGAADRLEAVVRDLNALPREMTRFLAPSAGTYNCRPIAGTDRMSMHAYGAAIDISTSHADYWRWAGGEGAAYRNRIPAEIVAVFERHGFIWGGRWTHFDTMHFEYRPEL